jgi:pimeloyl-ACP methyl ester carboxylesterase
VIEQRFEARHTYYRTNDLRAGRDTLVFVHGVSGSCSAWREYESRFEDHYNVLTYDLRGHGRSKKYGRSSDYTIRCFVDDLNALLDHLGIETCVLISHSFAVLIALEYLRAHPSRIGRAVFLSGDFDVGRRWHARLLRSALVPLGLFDFMESRIRPGTHIDYRRFPQTGDWNLWRMRADIANTTWRVYLSCTKAAYGVHAETLLPQICIPVLLVHGKKDTIFPVESSVYMAARLPRAELVLLEDANHILVLNRPREVGDAIERFLSREQLPAQAAAHVHENRQRGEVLHEGERRRHGPECRAKGVPESQQDGILQQCDPDGQAEEGDRRQPDQAGPGEHGRRQAPRELADEHRAPSAPMPEQSHALDLLGRQARPS